MRPANPLPTGGSSRLNAIFPTSAAFRVPTCLRLGQIRRGWDNSQSSENIGARTPLTPPCPNLPNLGRVFQNIFRSLARAHVPARERPASVFLFQNIGRGWDGWDNGINLALSQPCPNLKTRLGQTRGWDNLKRCVRTVEPNDLGRMVGHGHAIESADEGETKSAICAKAPAQARTDDGPRQDGSNRHRCRGNGRQAGVRVLERRGEDDSAVSADGRHRPCPGESLRRKEENSLGGARRSLEVDATSIPPEGGREARATGRRGGQQADPGGRWSHQDRRGLAQREHGTGCAR